MFIGRKASVEGGASTILLTRGQCPRLLAHLGFARVGRRCDVRYIEVSESRRCRETAVFELLHPHYLNKSRCRIAVANASSSEPRATRILVSRITSSLGAADAWRSTC